MAIHNLGRLTASLSGMTRMSEMIGEHPACLIMMDGWSCRCKLSVLTLAVVLTKKAKHDRHSVLSKVPLLFLLRPHVLSIALNIDVPSPRPSMPSRCRTFSQDKSARHHALCPHADV
jgi:hypothetical protein